MQYAIHALMAGHVADRMEERFFSSVPEARLWLKQQVREGRWPGAEEDYVVEPYDEQGCRINRLDTEDVELCAAQAVELLQRDPLLTYTLNTMIASRQLYVVGVKEMCRRLAELRQTEAVAAVVEQILIQTAANAAEKPFDAIDLATTLDVIRGFLKGLIERDLKEQEMQETSQRTEREQARRRQNLELPFMPAALNGVENWPRQKSVCFVGHPAGVDYILRLIKSHLQQGPSVGLVHFAEENQENSADNTVSVAAEVWRGCCNSSRKLERLWTACQRRLHRPWDVLLVSDLAGAYKATTAIRDPFSQASQAHRRLQYLTNREGACLIAGLPISQLKVNWRKSPKVQRLDAFTTLRFVSVVELEHDPQQVTVQVGHSTFAATVPRSELKPFPSTQETNDEQEQDGCGGSDL